MTVNEHASVSSAFAGKHLCVKILQSGEICPVLCYVQNSRRHRRIGKERAMVKTIGNPLTWTARALSGSAQHIGEGTGELGDKDEAPIEIRDIDMDDLRSALRAGADDFTALRTDVMFIVLIYPIVGALLAVFALNRDMIPLLFPMIAGFALLGPVAAIGLYEMSRRREKGMDAGWGNAFAVIGSPSFIPMAVLGVYLALIFSAWMFAAYALYGATLGPEPPASIGAFIGDVFGTSAGWVMIVAGMAIGFVFAAIVLAISFISFPLLIDRQVGLPRAITTSVQIARQNPRTVAAWGLIVAVSLAVGIGTLFVGLIFVLPVLGHATWHLYRRAVV